MWNWPNYPKFVTFVSARVRRTSADTNTRASISDISDVIQNNTCNTIFIIYLS